jgi:hypothetical protein
VYTTSSDRETTKKQTMVEGDLEVVENALHSHEMGLTRIVHVEARLLDRIGDIKHVEGEVMESLG